MNALSRRRRAVVAENECARLRGQLVAESHAKGVPAP